MQWADNVVEKTDEDEAEVLLRMVGSEKEEVAGETMAVFDGWGVRVMV